MLYYSINRETNFTTLWSVNLSAFLKFGYTLRNPLTRLIIFLPISNKSSLQRIQSIFSSSWHIFRATQAAASPRYTGFRLL